MNEAPQKIYVTVFTLKEFSGNSWKWSQF